MSGCPSEYRLDDYWLRGLPAEHPVHDHVATCHACQERIDDYRTAETTFRDEILPAAALGDEIRPVDRTASRPGRRLRWLLPGMVVAAAAAAAMIWVLPAEDDYLGSKCGIGLRIFCQRDGQVMLLEPGDTTHPEDALRFVPIAPAAGYVAILSVDGAGVVSRYVPYDGEVAHPVSTRDEPLPGSILLDDILGPERIVVFFSTDPFRLDAAEAWLKSSEPLPPEVQKAEVHLHKRARGEP